MSKKVLCLILAVLIVALAAVAILTINNIIPEGLGATLGMILFMPTFVMMIFVPIAFISSRTKYYIIEKHRVKVVMYLMNSHLEIDGHIVDRAQSSRWVQIELKGKTADGTSIKVKLGSMGSIYMYVNDKEIQAKAVSKEIFLNTSPQSTN